MIASYKPKIGDLVAVAQKPHGDRIGRISHIVVNSSGKESHIRLSDDPAGKEILYPIRLIKAVNDIVAKD